MDLIDSLISLRILMIALKFYIVFPWKDYTSSKLFLLVSLHSFFLFKNFLRYPVVLGCLHVIYSEVLKNELEALSMWGTRNLLTLNFTPGVMWENHLLWNP